MIAPKVAKGACDLEPKSIQMPELQYWVIRAHALRKACKSSCSNNSNPVYSGVRDATKLNFSIRLASTFAQRVLRSLAFGTATDPSWLLTTGSRAKIQHINKCCICHWI